MRFLFSSFFLLIFCACDQSPITDSIIEEKTEKDTIVVDSNSLSSIDETSCLDSILFKNYNLVNIQSLDSSICVDIKYSTTDNFTHQKMYLRISKAYLQKKVAQRLVECQHYLKSLHPSYSLLIYDAVRPLSVQQKMWDFLDSIPVNKRSKFVSNPRNHSIHNYGCAVDLTIIDEHKIPLDMGSFYDDIRKIAYPRMEAHFLQTGELTSTQIENRKLLRGVMKAGKFSNIATEWWHFNAHSRQYVKENYSLLLEEPSCDY